jgi:zinc D-Ala-D-Ala dipeptidase
MTIGLTWRRTARRIKRLKETVLAISPDYSIARPLQIQKIMWKAIGDERYVSDPSKEAGRHTRGTAVDVTLVHSSGYELPMPTDFDEFGELAHRQTGNHLEPAARNCLLLERIMVLHGFNPYPFEWWHFDYIGWEKYPALDVSFESLEQLFNT